MVNLPSVFSIEHLSLWTALGKETTEANIGIRLFFRAAVGWVNCQILEVFQEETKSMEQIVVLMMRWSTKNGYFCNS